MTDALEPGDESIDSATEPPSPQGPAGRRSSCPTTCCPEGGAGETVRRRLLQGCDVHTLLRLSTGIFCRPGVKTNVLFFDKKPGREEPWTRELWIYELADEPALHAEANPLTYEALADFIEAYSPEDRNARVESERFRRFSCDELMAWDKASLDIFWLRDESLEDTDNLPLPAVIAAEIAEDLEAALAQFAEIATSLEGEGG